MFNYHKAYNNILLYIIKCEYIYIEINLICIVWFKLSTSPSVLAELCHSFAPSPVKCLY